MLETVTIGQTKAGAIAEQKGGIMKAFIESAHHGQAGSLSIQELWDAVDEDNSGTICFEEFKVMHTLILKDIAVGAQREMEEVDDLEKEEKKNRKLVFLSIGLFVLLLLLAVGTALLSLAFSELVRQQYVKGKAVTDEDGNILKTVNAMVSLPLYVAPVLPFEQLDKVETLSVLLKESQAAAGLSEVKVTYKISEVFWYSDTAVKFGTLNGDAIEIYNGTSSVRTAAGKLYTVCAADVSCSSFKVDDEDQQEALMAAADAALLAAGKPLPLRAKAAARRRRRRMQEDSGSEDDYWSCALNDDSSRRIRAPLKVPCKTFLGSNCPDGALPIFETPPDGVIIDGVRHYHTARVELTFGEVIYNGPTITNITTRGYNGGINGPIIMVNPGDTLKIKLSNALPTERFNTKDNKEFREALHNFQHDYDTTNIHTHGVHVGSTAPGDSIFIRVAPGESYEYEYHIDINHAGGTHWYHPHVHGSTAIHAGGGALGMLIIKDPPGYLPPSIENLESIPLVLAHMNMPHMMKLSQEFEEECNKLAGATPEACRDKYWAHVDEHVDQYGGELMDGVLVNGLVEPEITLAKNRWYRFNMVFAAVDAALTPIIPNCETKLLAKDGVYVSGELPRDISTLGGFMGPGNRADWLVRCTSVGEHKFYSGKFGAHKHGSVHDQAHLDWSQGGDDGAPKNEQMELIIATFKVVDEGDELYDLPRFKVTRPCYQADLFDHEANQEEKTTSTLFAPLHMGPSPEISEQIFEYAKEPFGDIKVGSVIDYKLQGVHFHPLHFHVHHLQFQHSPDVTWGNYFLKGDWHDVVLLPGEPEKLKGPKSTMMIAKMPYDKFTGEQVFHCHLLDHEDAGMMQYMNVIGRSEVWNTTTLAWDGQTDDRAEDWDPTCYRGPYHPVCNKYTITKAGTWSGSGGGASCNVTDDMPCTSTDPSTVVAAPSPVCRAEPRVQADKQWCNRQSKLRNKNLEGQGGLKAEVMWKLEGNPVGCIYQHNSGFVAWVTGCWGHENCGTFKATHGYVLEPLVPMSAEACDYWYTMAAPSEGMGLKDIMGSLSWSSSEIIVEGGEPYDHPSCQTSDGKHGPTSRSVCERSFQRVVDTVTKELTMVKCFWSKNGRCMAGDEPVNVAHCYNIGTATPPSSAETSDAKRAWWDTAIADAGITSQQKWWAKYAILGFGLA